VNGRFSTSPRSKNLTATSPKLSPLFLITDPSIRLRSNFPACQTQTFSRWLSNLYIYMEVKLQHSSFLNSRCSILNFIFNLFVCLFHRKFPF
jgi:hypothetical protein